MSTQTVTLPEFNTNIDDLFARMDPEPPTSLEKEYASNMSDIEFSIFRHKLATVATEGKEVMVKLAVSSALRSEDSGAGIYTACGDMSSAAAGLPSCGQSTGPATRSARGTSSSKPARSNSPTP